MNNAWNIQLSMEDGSPAKWDGKLKIHVDKDKISLKSADIGAITLNDDALKDCIKPVYYDRKKDDNYKPNYLACI